MSLDALIVKIASLQNPSVVGLDPNLEKIPEKIRQKAFSKKNGFEAAADAILEFNKGIIDAVCDIVPAVKPQCACHEKYGWQGVRALSENIKYAKEKGLFVITDGKRNDIGTTMEAYAAAHLGEVEINGKSHEPFGADALTVNGYTGTDGIAPLLKTCLKYDKGFFVLVKTSNPSSGELQDKYTSGDTIYGMMGRLCEKWGRQLPGKYGYSGVGAVVGATYPRQLAELRSRLQQTFFLVPGYGAQGAEAADVVGGFDKNGLGAIINSARAVIYAYEEEGTEDYAGAARRAAVRMRDEIMSFVDEISLIA
jgi:orotidine-5'-phosphate decarboxylase